jgi:hypothetical protein
MIEVYIYWRKSHAGVKMGKQSGDPITLGSR